MLPEAARLHAALLAACDEVGAGPEARSRLDHELAELLVQPFPAQRRTPGEVWRDVTRSELPESAREAQLAWGIAKAKALAAPAVLYVGGDLMDRSKLAPVVAGVGARLVDVRSAAELDALPTTVLRAFVDLTAPHADEAIRVLGAAGVVTVAFGPHVDDVALVRARALGADDALPRSVFFRRLPDLLPARA